MAVTKQLEITQAVEGEKFNKTVQTFQEFKKELVLNGVNDVFSSMTIKQDDTKYIFAMNNKNLFAIDGKVNLVSRLQKFYKEKGASETQKEEEQVLIRLEGLELQHITTKTQEELALLQEDITKTENLSERSTNIENVKYKVERLITVFEQERDLAQESSSWFSSKYDKKDDNLRKIHKKEIERRIKELNKIKEQIELLANNKGKNYEIERDIDPIDNTKEVSTIKEVKMDDVNAMDMTMTLKQLSDRIEEIGKEVPDFITARNDIILEKGDTNPYYEIIIHDKSDARKISKSLKKINNQYAILDKLELTAAKRQELSQDLQDLETYLNKVIDNPDTFKPSENPFVPTHSKDFYKLVELDPTLAAFAKLNKKADKTANKDKNKNKEKTDEEGTGAATTETEEEGTETDKTKKEYNESNYESSRDAFEKGGVGGVMKHWMDQSNMKPEQKQFRGGVGNLALTGGMIFVGWKMIKSARNLISGKHKGDENKAKRNADRARLLGPTALIFGSQARSGEGPMSLFKGGALTEKLSGIFGGKTETGDEQSDTSLKYKSFPGATALFNGLNYGEMKQFLIQDGDRMKIDPAQYDTLLDMFKTGSKKNEAAAAFLESMGKNDDKNMLDLALTGMGVERDDIQDDKKKESKFDEKAGPAIIRLRTVSEYLEDKGYNKVNPETMKLVDNYISQGDKADYDLEELDARGDVFYKDTEVVDKTGLEDEITTIAGTDLQRKADLLLAINTFYDKMPTADKKIELSGTRPTITFKTYDQTSTIDLEDKALDGFTPTGFDSYLETFKAANLTNRIKFICKDKEAKSENPFYLSTPGKDITFDDATLFSTSFDTEIMTAGWGGSLKNVSPKLDKFKSEYCDYLNTLKFWKTTTA